MNYNENLKKDLEAIEGEVNFSFDVTLPSFDQNSFDFSRVLSECGKLYSRAKANLKTQELEYENWEAVTELNIRSHYENINSAKTLLDEKFKGERITEARIKAEVKKDPDYLIKQQNIIEAEYLFHLSEKALFEACKLRGFISQAILNKEGSLKNG